MVHHSDYMPAASRMAMCLSGKWSNRSQFRSVSACAAPVLGTDVFLVSSERYTGGLESHLVEAVHLPDNRSALPAFFDAVSPDWRTRIQPLIKMQHWTDCHILGGLPRSVMHGGPARHQGNFPGVGSYTLRQHWECEQTITRQEKKRGREYAIVVVARNDLHWVGPPQLALPPFALHQPHGCWIPCSPNDWSGWCDHFALCDRQSARAYLTRAQSLPTFRPTVFQPGPACFSNGWGNCNTECGIADGLAQRGVPIYRFEAPFVRECPSKESRGSMGGSCKHYDVLNVSAKVSGARGKSQGNAAIHLVLSQAAQRGLAAITADGWRDCYNSGLWQKMLSTQLQDKRHDKRSTASSSVWVRQVGEWFRPVGSPLQAVNNNNKI